MATQDYAASIQGVAVRITRLDANGNLLNTAGDSYLTTAFMTFSFTPEYDTGDEITQKAASGAVCVTYQAPDTLKRITIELAICEPDPELSNLLSGGILLRKNFGTFGSPINKSVGWASPAVGDDPSGNGVCVEAWSLAIKDGKKAAVNPYFHWVFPYAKLNQSGDRVIENGLLANTFSGYGLGNEAFGDGPDGRWEWPTAADRPYSYARSDWAPSGNPGFYTWHDILTASVSNKARTANVATLTTSAPHGFLAGDFVNITGSALTGFTGGFTILTAPTATTFTYASTGTDVTSGAVSPVGTATVGAGGRAVTDLVDSPNDDITYNVPGNKAYNADLPNDFAIESTEDPTS
jgi:hypothetical protein